MSIFMALGTYMDMLLMNRLDLERNSMEAELQRGGITSGEYEERRNLLYLEKKVR